MTWTRTADLSTAHITARVDLDRGAEIVSLVDARTGVDVLLTTPWASEARRMRPAILSADVADSEAVWTASYAGGWQTLFPNAGEPTTVDGKLRHYHGEASSVAWQLDAVSVRTVSAHLELSTVPFRIDRHIGVVNETITVTDSVVNLSSDSVAYDYQSHPAFGAPFLDAGCTVHLDAVRYVPDPRFDLGEFRPGAAVSWPLAIGRTSDVDLSVIPPAEAGIGRFGWLERFGTPQATITNPGLGLAATLRWSGDVGRCFAWVWLDCQARTTAPWNGAVYAFAIEPSTRTTDGAGAQPRLAGGERATFTTSLHLHRPDTEQRSSCQRSTTT